MAERIRAEMAKRAVASSGAGGGSGDPMAERIRAEMAKRGVTSSGASGGSPMAERISAEILKSGSPETLQLFLNYAKFIKSLMAAIRGDLLVLKVLIMMSLFSADRSTHVDRGRVQAVQESYAALLQVRGVVGG